MEKHLHKDERRTRPSTTRRLVGATILATAVGLAPVACSGGSDAGSGDYQSVTNRADANKGTLPTYDSAPATPTTIPAETTTTNPNAPATITWPNMLPTPTIPERPAQPNTTSTVNHSVGRTVVATIYNKVTNGLGMREDTAAYLSTRPRNYCIQNNCYVNDTRVLHTGDQVVLDCQTVGEETTNGDDTSPADDANPELFRSNMWYHATLSDRQHQGFIAAAWIAPTQRNGQGLPTC